MDIGGMVVITRTIEVGWHEADGIKTMLLAQSLTQLNPGNLGNGVSLVDGLQRPCQQGLFANRLLGKFGINAAAT